MKPRVTWAVLLLTFAWTFTAQAIVTTFQGVTVDYGNAGTNWVGGELVLTYASTSVNGTLSLGCSVVADILVVGGGGGGGGGYSSSGSSYYGNGGTGGAVVEKKDQLILAGSLTMKVGGGGAGSSNADAKNYGGDGKASSISGAGLDQPITADGGAGGQCRQSNSAKKSGTGASGSGSAGKVSEITGNTYGVGGKAGDGTTAGNETDNTGNGGKGGRNSSNSTNRKGGNGGSGIVVVRLKEAYSVTDVELADLSLAQGETVSSFADASTGASVEIRFGQVGSVSFSVDNVARAERTKDGTFVIVGVQPGTTQATIPVMNTEEKAFTTYTVGITVSAPVELQDVSLQRGETVAAFNLQGSGDATTFDSVDVKDVKFTPAEIAERVETPDGKVGIVGKLARTTAVTIVTAGQSYKFRVTVAKLLSGLYRAGAYEVAVTNASDVFYVDGDLVIAYRDADGDTAKSFTLPRPTAGRLLAIGGGGAGGTYKTPYAKSGALPGGGGAGRMIEKSDYELAAQRYEVVVGKGGTAATVNTSDAKGGDGGDTTVAGLTAKGGGGGA